MLARLKELDETIKVSITGIDTLGKGLLYQTTITPGIKCVAIADREIENCVKAAHWLNLPYRIVATQNELDDAINDGELAICQDGNMVAKAASVEAVIEASSTIMDGAAIALTAIRNQRHIIMMNTPVDSAFGPHLMKYAHDNGVTYSSSDGGQPAILRKLYDDMQLWGFEPVMAGNIEGQLDRYANPTLSIPEAEKREMDLHKFTSISDGTNLNLQMSIVANALNMVTAMPGMYGHRANSIEDIFDLYDLEMIHSFNNPVVDYILGTDMVGGVFTVGFSDNPFQKEMMDYYRMGDGPFFAFYRPYSLGHVEAMENVARAVLDEQALIQPTYGLKTNVYAYAKKPLRAGQTLDGIGGYNCYGLIENCPPINEDSWLPIALADGVVLRRDIEVDEKISLLDVEFNPTALDFDLYFKSQKRDFADEKEFAFRPGQFTHW